MANEHELLEAFIGEAAAYFPATSTATRPAATLVDAWYTATTGPIALVMTQYSVTSALVRNMLGEDFLMRWLWRTRMYGSSARSTADIAESYQQEPQFPSNRTMKAIRAERGDVHSSED